MCDAVDEEGMHQSLSAAVVVASCLLDVSLCSLRPKCCLGRVNERLCVVEGIAGISAFRC